MDKNRLKPPSGLFDSDSDRWLQVAKMAEMGLSAAAVAHEAKQPLSALKMTLQLMRDGSEDAADAKERLDNALAQTERLECLLGQLRSFLLPDSQARSEVDLAGLVDGVLKLLGGGLKEGKIDISSEFQPNLPRVVAEKDKIEQVVFNLIVNAKDAVLESGGGRVAVLVFQNSPDSVKLVVADDGPGIDPAIEGKIFEPYFSTKGKDRGTGLGLYIARRIAEQHGASLEILDERARAELGRGKLSTAFQLSFLVPVQRLTVPPTVPTAKQENKALVVSNHEEEARLLEEAVKGEGYECDFLLSGEEALSLLDGKAFNLLIVSANLHDITGLEIARLARNLNPLMPILLITDHLRQDLESELLTLRRAGCLRRPIDMTECKEMIRYLTGADRPKSENGGAKLEKTAQRPQVALVEVEKEIRDNIGRILTKLGCEVTEFVSENEADLGAQNRKFDILVANIDVLKNSAGRLSKESGRGAAMISLAITAGGGIEKTIEAIHAGARGVFYPPFEEDRIALELKRVAGWRIDE